jgi:hypothetical protein
MRAVGILGAGFGLYGHLPAAVLAGAEEIVLLDRYLEVFQGRSELSALRDLVRWVATERDMLRASDTIVLARTPTMNFRSLQEILSYPNIRRFLIEKPHGPDPFTAQLSGEQLGSKSWRVSLPFRHLAWGRQTLELLECESNAESELRINWSFKAHHFQKPAESWKKHHAEGGGPLRFYGIHVIALLAEAGFDTARTSTLIRKESTPWARWEADFFQPGKPSVTVSLDSEADLESFSVSVVKKADGYSSPIFESKSPFGPECSSVDSQKAPFDLRVASLKKVYETFHQDDRYFQSLYVDIVLLWQSIEKITLDQPCRP